MIDARQFGKYAGHPELPAASYKLTAQHGERGVYSFACAPGRGGLFGDRARDDRGKRHELLCPGYGKFQQRAGRLGLSGDMPQGRSGACVCSRALKRRRMPRPGDTPRWRSGMRISCKEFPARAMAGFEVPICQARSSGISGRFCQALFRRVWPRPHSALNGRSRLCAGGAAAGRGNPNFQPGAHSARREFLLRHRCALPGGRRRGLCRGAFYPRRWTAGELPRR